jgi:hypothetical protein
MFGCTRDGITGVPETAQCASRSALHSKQHSRDQIKTNDIGGKCGLYGGQEGCETTGETLTS